MYESLISNLREHAEWAHANEWESPITLGDDLEGDIKAIEALQAELDRLKNCRRECKIVCLLDEYNKKCAELEKVKAENARLRREREAAVRDLETIMFVGGQNTDTCNYCKTHTCYDRNGCKPCNPKWRGPDGRGEAGA